MEPPRPLAGLPVVSPAVIARAWLVRRIAAVPLVDAAGLVDGRFVAEGPALCGSLLAALGDDAALGALLEEGSALAALLEPASPDGAESFPGREPRGLVAATEHLRRAALDVLAPGTDPALLAPLHDRLAHACAALAGSVVSAQPHGPETHHASTITARDTRGHGGFEDDVPQDPRARLTAEVERLAAAKAPFALLAVEVEDAAVVPVGALAAAEAALQAALPAGALHAPDGPGSLLVLVPGTDGRALARTLTQAVGGAASHRGAPLRAAAGVAEHPRDGDGPEALLAHADGQLFAARAGGLPLA